MPNQTYALEWLNLAKRNLDTARLLIRENHYTHSEKRFFVIAKRHEETISHKTTDCFPPRTSWSQ